jgi:ribose transport system permease protein
MSTVEDAFESGLGRLRGMRAAALRDYGIVFAFIALFVTLSLASDVFLKRQNFMNILDQWSAIGIISIGSTLVFIAGGFDLSIAAVFALSGIISAKAAEAIGVAPGMVLGCLIGLGVGICNGAIVTVGRINPFMATLASSLMIRGLALAVSGGFLVRVADDKGFDVIGRGEFLGAKYSAYLFAGVILVCGLLLHRTTYGRYMYASGGNAEAARLSGVRVNLVKASTYAISGFCAGIGGMIVASRVNTGQADAGIGLEFDAIAAIVIGGTSILGGAGAIWRTVLGVLMLAMIQNGFNLLNVDAVYQRIIYGAIIIGAVGIDAWSRRTRA